MDCRSFLSVKELPHFLPEITLRTDPVLFAARKRILSATGQTKLGAFMVLKVV